MGLHGQFVHKMFSSFWDKIKDYESDYSFNDVQQKFDDILQSNLGDSSKAEKEINSFVRENFTSIDDDHVFALRILVGLINQHLNNTDRKNIHYKYYRSIGDTYDRQSSFILSKPKILKKLKLEAELNVSQRCFVHVYSLDAIKDNFDLLENALEKRNFLDELILRVRILKQNDVEFSRDADIVISYCESLLESINNESDNKKNTFYFEILDSKNKEDIIADLYDRLKRRPSANNHKEQGFIHSSIKKTQFNNIFIKRSGNYFEPVLWVGTKEELNLLINILDKKRILAKKNKWKIAVAVFYMKTVSGGLTNAKLGTATDYNKIKPENRKAIESIV